MCICWKYFDNEICIIQLTWNRIIYRIFLGNNIENFIEHGLNI